MRRRHGTGHQGTIGIVAKAHNVLVFVMLPLHEGAVNTVHIKIRIIGLSNEVFHIIPLEDDHLLTALGATLATIGNVGPGIAGVGPLENFSAIPALGKVLLIFLMLLGRLEIYAVLVIFIPMTWRR